MSASLWSSNAMIAAMRAVVNGVLPPEVTGISIDSRTVAPAEAYFAIKGAVHDGHDFVEAALRAGAALAVVERGNREQFASDAPLLMVDDVLGALVELAHAARARLQGQVIAVTGSVGKTSTKEALRLVLSAQGQTHASAASFNNHWGVPLSLARCPETARFAVFEIGMNHAGEIQPLVKMVRPHVAIITTVEPVHLEFFAGIEAIADAKAEIFEGVVEGGAVVLNRDNPQFARLARRAKELGIQRVVSFGADAKSDARLIDVSLQAACSAVHADIFGHEVTYKVGMPGRHMAMNSLAVLAAAALAGADLALASLLVVAARASRWTRRSKHARIGRRRGHLDRRELQCQPGVDGGGAQCARPGRDRPAWPPYRRAWRHAGTGRGRRRSASRPERGHQGQPHRSRVLLWSFDAQPVGSSFHGQAGRLCR